MKLSSFLKDSRVDRVSDETDLDDGYWIYLKQGFYDFDFDPLFPTRVIHEYRKIDLIKRMAGVRETKEMMPESGMARRK